MSKKETLKHLYSKEKLLYKHPNKVKCFFSALDQKLEGNKLYDWYWWNIWSNLWKALYDNPKERRRQAKYNKQRIKYGVSEQDCWSITDWLLETMYYALGNFLEGEYGNEPINWKERCCETHDKKLYTAVMKFRAEYEHLQNIRKREEKFDTGEDSVEAWFNEYQDMMAKDAEIEQNCCKLLKNILNKYMEKLWW